LSASAARLYLVDIERRHFHAEPQRASPISLFSISFSPAFTRRHDIDMPFSVIEAPSFSRRLIAIADG